MRRTCLFAVLLAVSGTALAELPADMPRRKPGLWELKSSIAEMGGMGPVIHQCIDGQTDDLLARQAEKGECSDFAIRKEGGRIVVNARCPVEGSTAIMNGAFTGDFTRSYRGELRTRYEPPLHGMSATTMTQEGRWLGPCKPGQKPGDMEMQGMPGMGSFNLDELRRNMPQMPSR